MFSVSFIANIVPNDELKCPSSSHARSTSVQIQNAIRLSLNQSHNTLTWCDVVLDSKHLKTTENNTSHPAVPIYEAAQGGYRAGAGVQRGGTEEDRESDSSDGYGYGSNDGGGGGGDGGDGIGGRAGGSNGGRDDDDDDVRGRRSAFTDTESEESESDSEDDVPLAQRIPGALQAQKSIRVKERERRRRERAARAAEPRVDELAKRLQQVQVTTQHVPSSRTATATATATQPAASPPTRTLRRPAAYSSSVPQPRHVSLEEPRPRHISAQETSPPLHAASRSRNPSINNSPQTQAQLLSRSGVPRKSGEDFPPQQPFTRNGTRKSAGEEHTQQQQQQQQQKQQQKQQQPPLPSPQQQATVARARTLSSGATPHRVLQRARTSPMPPLPPNTQPQPQLQAQKQGQDTATQHRFFIGDMQRFNTVAISPSTCARDVLDLVRARGELEGSGQGGWMVWELAQDFGMERPLREYELPAEVYASWNSNTRLNAFMIKKTPLAAVLARTAMPASSPRCSGYVQWESKRGKWNKRWMELREHSLWLSKRDTGKDETFLCSLSNFDCYYVSRLHKAPKAFVFAVKSTDNLTLFENPADYLHVFACDQRDGQQWMERILLARSYVLYKERTVLFTAPSNPAPSNNASSSSSSSHVHKSPPARQGQGTLVNFDAMQSPVAIPTRGPFQSGSLLAKTSV